MRCKCWVWDWAESEKPLGIKNLCEYYRHAKRDGSKIEVWLVTPITCKDWKGARYTSDVDYALIEWMPGGLGKRYTTRATLENNDCLKNLYDDFFEEYILKRKFIGDTGPYSRIPEKRLWKYDYSNIRRVRVLKKRPPNNVRPLWNEV